jgi:hypothetical protein
VLTRRRAAPRQAARGEDGDDQAGAGRGADRRRGQIEAGVATAAGALEPGDGRIGTALGSPGAPSGSIGMADAAGAPRVPAIAAPLSPVAIVRFIVVESMSTPSGHDRPVRSMHR